MTSVKINFQRAKKSNPGWSSLICFIAAVRGRNFGRQTIRRWFNRLVDSSDYSKGDKKAIIRQIEELAKAPEDNQK